MSISHLVELSELESGELTRFPPIWVNFPVRIVLSLMHVSAKIFLSSEESMMSPFKYSSTLTLFGLTLCLCKICLRSEASVSLV